MHKATTAQKKLSFLRINGCTLALDLLKRGISTEKKGARDRAQARSITRPFGIYWQTTDYTTAQFAPFKVNAVGLVLLPLQEPLKPKLVLPPGAIVLL